MLNRSSRFPAACEGLEPRCLLSKPAPIEKFSLPAFYFNDVESSASGGTGSAPMQKLIIRNAGVLPLIFNSKGLVIDGADAGSFSFVGKAGPFVVQPGATHTIGLKFTASSLGIKSAVLRAVSNDKKHHSVSIPLRGLGTKGEGGENEPSLQTILDLFQIPDTVGEADPSTTDFKVPPRTPNDEVDLQTMVQAGPGKVTIQPLAAFVNDFSPALLFGWYHAGEPDLGIKQLFTIPSNADSQSVAVTTLGKTSFGPGVGEPFGIYTAYPAFSYRKSYSEDALNTWEPKTQNRKKMRFYPLKNPDGTVVPNAYVFAGEDFNQVYDFQDGVFIIRNVMPAPAVPEIGLQNTDGLPSNTRMVFNRITNLDLVRPNVVHDTDTLSIINSGGATLTVSSLQLSDSVNFKIVGGGGSNIHIAPHSQHNVTIQFVAAPTSGLTATYAATLQINSNDPDEPRRVVTLAGLWQNSSEQTASHQYSEPSLKTLVNTIFGYTTTILNPGETTNHQGKPVLVGDEILSPYFNQADPAEPITARLLAAFHRQNNFDPVTMLPLTAASTLYWYSKGQSSQLNKIFTHNIDQGQALLQDLSGSTTKPAQGTFRQKTSTPFGFNVDKTHFTDDSLNQSDFDPVTMVPFPGQTGHSIRVFPLKDANGNLIPNTYLLAMDYTANVFANWDYNDNLFIISNITPAGTSATPMAVSAKASSTPSLFGNQPVDGSKNPLDDNVNAPILQQSHL